MLRGTIDYPMVPGAIEECRAAELDRGAGLELDAGNVDHRFSADLSKKFPAIPKAMILDLSENRRESVSLQRFRLNEPARNALASLSMSKTSGCSGVRSAN